MPDVDQARVDRAVAKYKADLKAYSAFGEKHGFMYRGPEHFKRCVVFVFKTKGDRVKCDEKAKLRRAVRDHWRISPDEFMTEDAEYIAAGIYIAYHWGHAHWAIPNEFPETQAFVRERLPAWAEERLKR